MNLITPKMIRVLELLDFYADAVLIARSFGLNHWISVERPSRTGEGVIFVLPVTGHTTRALLRQGLILLRRKGALRDFHHAEDPCGSQRIYTLSRKGWREVNRDLFPGPVSQTEAEAERAEPVSQRELTLGRARHAPWMNCKADCICKRQAGGSSAK